MASGWMERQLRPPDEGKWTECRNLALATRVGDPGYPYQLTVAINWDGPVEAEDSGLAGAHDLVAGELTVSGLCLHAFTFKASLEWDLVFYTRAPGVALGIVERLGQQLPQATLVPETNKDPSWNYYRERQGVESAPVTTAAALAADLGVMQTRPQPAMNLTTRSRVVRVVVVAIIGVVGFGHVRYCGSSTYRVRNETGAVLLGVSVPFSYDGENRGEVQVGELPSGQGASGYLPRLGEASVGIRFAWKGAFKEDCYGYLQGTLSHAEFVIREDGSVECRHEFLEPAFLGWLNTL